MISDEVLPNLLRTLRSHKQHYTEIRRRANWYSVPIVNFSGIPGPDTVTSSSTGILFKCFYRYFVLTAGHCAQDVKEGSTAIVIDNKPNLFRPPVMPAQFKYEKDTERDIGYLEIPERDAKKIEAMTKLFLGVEYVSVRTPEQIMESGHWMVVCGYASDAIVGKCSWSPGYKIIVYSTAIAGDGITPASSLQRIHDEYQVLDLWIPNDNDVQMLEEAEADITIGALAGVSGGGCWDTGLDADNADWDHKNMRLVGIHSGSSGLGRSAEGGEELFTREILIGHHLKLIASNYPDLHDALHAQFDSLSEYIV